MLRVTRAEHLDHYRIRLAFNDGTNGTLDLQGRLDGPIFQPLNDLELFQQFELTDHTLTWPNGADFAPEYLYELVTKTATPSKS